MNSTPVLTPYRKSAAIEHLKDALTALQALPTQTPCTECDNYQEGHCRKWGAEVPPEHRGLGCDEFVDQVPF